MCRRKVGLSFPKKNWGPKNFYICSVFRRQVNGEYLLNKMWHGNQARVLESTKGLLRCRKISGTLVHKRFKTIPEVFAHVTRNMSKAAIEEARHGFTRSVTANTTDGIGCVVITRIITACRCLGLRTLLLLCLHQWSSSMNLVFAGIQS